MTDSRLAPPPEHDSKEFHWVRVNLTRYTVGRYAPDSASNFDWVFLTGPIERCTAEDAHNAGYRYMGPAALPLAQADEG